jgi:hypothetical protein
MTREEHLEWSKRRALEYLDAGETASAVASMMSDLRKHKELENHAGIRIFAGFMLVPGWISDPGEVRHWIEGFR